MDKQKLLTLLTKYERNECTEEEINLLKEWFQDFPEVGESPDLFDGEPEARFRDRVWDNVKSGIETNQDKPLARVGWYRVAAAVTIFLLGLIYWAQFRKIENVTSDADFISLSTGNDTVVYLPDSSKLLLEKNSFIRYHRDFADTRIVYLEGGCLFHVKKKLSTPFQVVSGDQITTVTGTIFSIKAYPGDTQVTTRLFEGSVYLTHERKSDSIYLKPNETVVYSVGSGQFTKLESPAIIAGSQVREASREALLFEGTLYEDIFLSLENRFDVTIYVDRASLRECSFSARFETETLEEMLSILASINHFKYRIIGNIVYIEDFEC